MAMIAAVGQDIGVLRRWTQALREAGHECTVTMPGDPAPQHAVETHNRQIAAEVAQNHHGSLAIGRYGCRPAVGLRPERPDIGFGDLRHPARHG